MASETQAPGLVVPCTRHNRDTTPPLTPNPPANRNHACMLAPDVICRLAGAHEFLNAVRAINTVPGWLADLEGFTLATLAAFDRPDDATGLVAEVGSFKGKSTCWLASGLMRRHAPADKPVTAAGRVHAIDHFTGSPEHQPGGTHPDPDIAAHGSTLPAFRANVERLGLADRVEAIQSPSLKAAAAWNRGPLRLIFIDGDHSYEASKADFDAWRPHVAPGGLIAFHDIGSWEGVTTFYNELLKSRDHHLTEEAAVGSLRVTRVPR